MIGSVVFFSALNIKIKTRHLIFILFFRLVLNFNDENKIALESTGVDFEEFRGKFTGNYKT
jgi:hypothetical protein